MKTYEELESLGIERCIECNCPVAEDWEYEGFTNKTVTKCPQCGESYNLEELTVVNKQ